LNQTTRGQLIILLLLALPLILIVACGGGDSETGSPTSSVTATATGETGDSTASATAESTAEPDSDLTEIAEAAVDGDWEFVYEVTDTTGSNVQIQVGTREAWTWELGSTCDGFGGCDHELTTFNTSVGESGPNRFVYSDGEYEYESPSIIYTNCTSGGATIEDSHDLSTVIKAHVSKAGEVDGVLTASEIEGTRVVRADATEIGQQNNCSSFTVTYEFTGTRSE
jgi:hypothetical protein